MDENKIIQSNCATSLKGLLFQFFCTLIAAIAFAFFLHASLVKYLDIYHTVLEMICVFISLSIFFAVWFTYKNSSVNNYVLGFGYLAVAVFDVLHTFYHLKLDLSAGSHNDLSAVYWITGRIAEALVMLLSMYSIKLRFNKWVAMLISLSVVFVMNIYANFFYNYLPVLLTQQGVTPTKIMLEYLVIFLSFATINKLKNKLTQRDDLTYKFIFIAVLLLIASEFCFTMYITVNSRIWTVGHILKITSYFYLFKGIFISTVTYPYEKLEEEHSKLETAYTELDNAHLETRLLTENLKNTLDTLPIAILKCGFDNKIEYINKNFENMLLCDRNDLFGLTLQEFFGKFLKNEHNEKLQFENLLESKMDNVSKIWVCKTMNGDMINLSISSHKIGSGLLLIFRDVKSEQELANVHLQTQTILNAVSNCVLILDINRRIILYNKAFENILDIEDKNIIGMSLDELDIFINSTANGIMNFNHMDNAEKRIYEITLVTEKNNVKELLMQFTSIKNVEGDIIGGICVGTDVTNHKKEQEKIMQQEKLALLGQMSASIVHEIKNFLATIKGHSQLIDVLTRKETVKKHSEKINSSIEEVNRILSEYLFLSKPSDTVKEKVSLQDIFVLLKEFIESSALIKGIKADFFLFGGDKFLLCDETQLKQVILNICKNASEAMSDVQMPKLKIITGYNILTGEIYIEITDNGKGISKEDIKKIGTPFFTTKKSGTGLGLNVCYKIIEQHNGRITVESEMGKGATFTILLPCVEDNQNIDNFISETAVTYN